jgi:hypothetical protein
VISLVFIVIPFCAFRTGGRFATHFNLFCKRFLSSLHSYYITSSVICQDFF